ncbi:hypothetical protein LJC64_04710 [Ruminococcaceae bacterium OttesenSCG-928-A11]|nr:hypothetical protein [Ruminococcaceae bacterium OttesenSCG-928-A11]
MPSRNTVREDIDDSYYHIYGRGSLGRVIFKDDQDKMTFLKLIQRYLGRKEQRNPLNNTFYPNYYGKIELLAYCVMGTHFHLLFWQQSSGLISQLMKSVLVSYTAYYNKKYSVRGPLLESRFKSSIIIDENYLLHLTRYIHLNPDDYRDYLFSSLAYYVAGLKEDWIKPDKIIEMFDLGPEGYWDLLKDYEEEKDSLNQMKTSFADDGISLEAEKQEKPF